MCTGVDAQMHVQHGNLQEQPYWCDTVQTCHFMSKQPFLASGKIIFPFYVTALRFRLMLMARSDSAQCRHLLQGDAHASMQCTCTSWTIQASVPMQSVRNG